MKSKTSCFNKTIFKKNFTHYWPIWGMILLWNLFVLPFLIYDSSLQYRFYNNMTQAQMEQQRLHDIISLLQAYISPGLLFLFAVAAVMAVFSYLYSPRAAYTLHSLPVTRLELFITNYISGLLFLIIPELIGFLAGTLVGAVCGYTCISYLFTGLLFAAGMSFFLYTFTVFIAMFTGQLFAVPVFSLILNFLFVGSRLLVAAMLELLSYGVTMSYESGQMDILSPLFYLLSNVSIEFDYTGSSVTVKGFMGAGIVAGYALAALALLAAAYFIYSRRHLETAGSLISIPWISPVFRWGAALCGGCFFSLAFCSMLGMEDNKSLFGAALAFAVLFGAAFFFGAQMFLEKGFRVFKKKRLMECGVFSAVLFLLLIGIEFDFLGQEKKMPDIADVENAFISSSYVIGGNDGKTIQDIYDIHSQIINSKKEFEAFASENHWVSGDLLSVNIKYYLKNGSVMRRSYNVPAQKEMVSDPKSVSGQLLLLSTVPDVYLNNLFGGDYKNITLQEGSIDLYGKDGEYEEGWFSEEEAEKIYRAVIADVKAGNFDSFIRNGFRYSDMEESVEETYYNSITLQYAFKKTTSINKNVLQREYNVWNEAGSAMISFDKNCRHVIEALIESGIIESEEDLCTRKDMERINDVPATAALAD